MVRWFKQPAVWVVQHLRTFNRVVNHNKRELVCSSVDHLLAIYYFQLLALVICFSLYSGGWVSFGYKLLVEYLVAFVLPFLLTALYTLLAYSSVLVYCLTPSYT